MLICKNDSTKKYKGNEPSPKGLGWCAYGEKIGSIRTGKDGNKWIVKKRNNNSKYWVKYFSNDQIIINQFKDMLKKNYISDKKEINNFFNILKKLDKIKYKWNYDVYKKILSTSKKNKSTFKVTSNSIVISDPTSIELKKNKNIHKAKNGNWISYTHSFITKKRPNIIISCHEKYPFDLKSNKYNYSHNHKVGIDANVVGIMDKDFYDSIHNSNNSEAGIELVENKFKGSNFTASLKKGYLSITGFGDGFYNYSIGFDKSNSAVQIIIHCIP